MTDPREKTPNPMAAVLIAVVPLALVIGVWEYFPKPKTKQRIVYSFGYERKAKELKDRGDDLYRRYQLIFDEQLAQRSTESYWNSLAMYLKLIDHRKEKDRAQYREAIEGLKKRVQEVEIFRRRVADMGDKGDWYRSRLNGAEKLEREGKRQVGKDPEKGEKAFREAVKIYRDLIEFRKKHGLRGKSFEERVAQIEKSGKN